MKMLLKLTLAIATWVLWPLAVAVAAIALRGMFEAIAEWRAKPAPRPVRIIGAEPEPEQRHVHIHLATGGIELRPPVDERVVIHGDGSEMDRSWR